MKKKLLYSAPEAELLVVRFEENFLTSPDGSWDKSIKEGSTWSTDDPEDGYGLE